MYTLRLTNSLETPIRLTVLEVTTEISQGGIVNMTWPETETGSNEITLSGNSFMPAVQLTIEPTAVSVSSPGNAWVIQDCINNGITTTYIIACQSEDLLYTVRLETTDIGSGGIAMVGTVSTIRS